MEKEIEKVILAFEEAAARRDTERLKEILHTDYRVVANNFKGSSGTTVISRKSYIAMMLERKVGGTVYETEIIQINITRHTAMAEVLFKSDHSSDMHKYLFLVQNKSNKWQVISDLPLIIE